VDYLAVTDASEEYAASIFMVYAEQAVPLKRLLTARRSTKRYSPEELTLHQHRCQNVRCRYFTCLLYCNDYIFRITNTKFTSI